MFKYKGYEIEVSAHQTPGTIYIYSDKNKFLINPCDLKGVKAVIDRWTHDSEFCSRVERFLETEKD